MHFSAVLHVNTNAFTVNEIIVTVLQRRYVGSYLVCWFWFDFFTDFHCMLMIIDCYCQVFKFLLLEPFGDQI